MTLSTGDISLGDAATELGLSLPISLGDPRIRGLADKSSGAISLGDLRGTGSVTFTLATGQAGTSIGFATGTTGYGAINPSGILGSLILQCQEVAGNLVFSLAGVHTQTNAFNALEINGVVFDAANAVSFSASTNSVWQWTGGVGMKNNSTYTVDITFGPGDAGYTAPTGTFPVGQDNNWTLTFSDEFNGTSVDTTKWNDHIWYDVSNPTINYSVSGGCLNIWPALDTTGNYFNRTFDTDGKFYQSYGYFEIRAKLPIGVGCWPAFWLFNHDDANDRPEIDIMEAYSGGGVASWWSDANNHPISYGATVWHGNPPTEIGSGKLRDVITPGVDLSAAFHVYGCRWTTTDISFYFDGTLICTIAATGSNALPKRMYVLLDLWFGSASGSPSTGQTPTGSGNAYQIDYVRVWSPGPGTSGGALQPYGQTAGALVFQDEFDGATVNAANWTTDIYYKTSNATVNYNVQNGFLNIWPQRDATGNFFERTLVSDGLQTWLYGYFEIEVQMPIGAGLHPAISLFNNDEHEIGIVHAYTGQPSGGWSNNQLHAIDWVNTVLTSQSSTVYDVRAKDVPFVAPDMSIATHKYAVRWDATTVKFFFDGVQVGPTINHTTMTVPMYLYIGLWLDSTEGAATAGTGTPSVTNKITPEGISNSLMVNYVRVWNLSASTPTTNPIVEFYGNVTLMGTETNTWGSTVVMAPVPPVQAFAQQLPAYDVRNQSVGSMSASNSLNGTDGVHPAWATQMANSPATYVVLGHGLVDLWNGPSVAQFKLDYQNLITQAKAAGKKPILMTMFVANWTGADTYAQAARDLAAANSIGLIDCYAFTNNMVANGTTKLMDYFPDGYRPTDQLCVQIGQYMASQWDQAIATGTAPQPASGNVYPNGPLTPTNFTLTLNEEFNNNALNTALWNDHIWYDVSDPTINYAVGNGQLNIWPASPFVNRTIDTDGKFYQTYGFFEIQAKLPIGMGCWPAFWLFNHDDSTHPEIDIMEAYPGGDMTTPWGDANHHPVNYVGTVWNNPNLEAGDHKLAQYVASEDLSTAYHKYGCLWEVDGVTFYFDGIEVGPKISFVSSRRMYILLDLWFGDVSGTPSVGGTPQGQTNSYSITYVRAWQIGTNNSGGTTGTTPAPTIHFYGASFINGTNGSTTGPDPVAQPVNVVVANDTGWSTAASADPGTSSTAFLNASAVPTGSFAWPRTAAAEFASATYCPQSVVVINFVINDWSNSQSQYEANLNQIITLAQNNGKTVILMGSQPTYQQLSNGGDATAGAQSDAWVATANQWMGAVASSAGVAFIDVYTYVTNFLTTNGLTVQSFVPDGLHPTQTGYTLIGHYITSRLHQILGV